MASANGTRTRVASDTVCRAALGDCELAEKCDGVATSCPADTLVAADTVCRAALGACDVAEKCDGVATSCPADTLVAADTICRATADACDVAEKCDGVATSYPADTRDAAGDAKNVTKASDSGCGCRVGGTPAGSGGPASLLLAVLGACALRRRSTRRR